MPITAECNVCGKKYQAPDNLAGKRVRCKQCGNIFPLGGEAQPPDLNALAEMERSHHSLDATAAGQTPGEPNDDDNESPRPLRTGRTNVRFAFPLAKEIDHWAPLALTLGGLAWLGSFIFRFDSTVPKWIPGAWFALAMLAFSAIICPICLSMIRSAGKQAGYQMPVNDRRRAFAAFLPAFAMTYMLWAIGSGKVVPLILGCIAGTVVATATVWLLFRLRPHEIPTTIAYAGVGLTLGILISGGIFFGLNMLTVNALVGLKKPDLAPASPFGPGYAWIDPAVRDNILTELAQAARPKIAPPSTDSATPAPVVPPPITSPIVRGSEVAPITGAFAEIIRPVIESHYIAVVRNGDNKNLNIEVWDTSTWKQQGSNPFNTSSEAGKRRVLSADGQQLARIVSFPKLSVQVWDYPRSQVRSVYFSEILGTPDLIGFISPSNLLILWQTDVSHAVLEVIDVANGTRIFRTREMASFDQSGSALAISRDGTLAAIASKITNVPTLSIYNLRTGDIQTSAPIASLDQRWPVNPTGLAFSPNAKQIAVLFEQSGSGLLQSYQIDLTKKTLALTIEQVYPTLPLPSAVPRPYTGSAIAWLPDSNGWILYGQRAFSASVNAPMVADLGVTGVQFCRVLSPDIVEMVNLPSGPNSARQITILHLDNAEITKRVK